MLEQKFENRFILIAFLVLSCSCSDQLSEDIESSNRLLLSRIINRHIDVVTTTNLTYSNGMLMEISDSNGVNERFVYEGNLPMAIERFYGDGQLQGVIQLTRNENLVRSEFYNVENNDTVIVEIIDYEFENNRLTRVERYRRNNFINWSSISRSDFFYNSQNNVERIVKIDSATRTPKQELNFTYTYDSNENPFSRIPEEVKFLIGRNNFINWYSIELSNNNIISENVSVNGQNQRQITYEYDFDSNGFPIRIDRLVNSATELEGTGTYTYE